MKKLKIAGYQGDGSVHTRSVKFFINKVSNYFNISFDQDITEKGKKAASLIEMTIKNEIQISYLWSSYYEKYIPEIKLLDLPFYFKNKNEVKNLINNNLQAFVSIKLIKIIRTFVELNILTKNWAAKILESLETNPNKKIKLKSFSNLPGVYAYAEGMKNGKRCRVGVSLEGEDDLNNLSMGEATGFPLACGVKMLFNDEIKETGVFAPESQNINPELFFQYLEKEIGETARIKPIISTENIF